jgi:hypothetical protein
VGGAICLFILAIGWSALWKLSADATASGIDDWLAAEANRGRTWTCPNKNVSGYPFRIVVSCVKPTFAANANGRQVAGSLAAITAFARLYDPFLIHVTLNAPFSVQDGETGDLVNMTWSAFNADVRLNDGTIGAIDILTRAPRLHVAAAQLRDTRLDADLWQFSLTRDAARHAEGAYDLKVALTGASNAQMDALTGESAPFDMSVAATILRADVPAEGPPPVRLEAWRQAQGAIELGQFKAAKGPASISASGRFDIDPAHRLHGAADISIVGMEGVLQRFGVPTAALAIGSLLSSVLPGAASTPGQPQKKPIRIPVTFENGRVSIGPVRTPLTLQPLY